MKTSASRRTFFGAMGAAASLAALAVAKKPVAAPAAAPALGKTAAPTGYQLSEHVKRYYRSTVA
ncbi:formate dehydrogenase [Comamonadaceae bacterium M7527]|nr:formate dehydrogenase [Comamonadaceae bacterium M7527]